MSCGNCSTHINKENKGCGKKDSCSSACNKMGVFDWLSNISPPNEKDKFNFVEVRFKNNRKEFFFNSNNLSLQIGQIVVCEAKSGYDVGVVSLTGELVKVQMNRKKETPDQETSKKIYRIASQTDVDLWQSVQQKENSVQKKSKELAINMGLKMKISDVEFQGDGTKATFYYTADTRVDFRELIKVLAQEFLVRIEMKQIRERQESARLGGIGSCGRELCCSTWLTDFRAVNSNAARYQQLSYKTEKLNGQCGRLKCCLNFELDSYLEALNDFPRTDSRLQTDKGEIYCQKVDVFKGLMWFASRTQPMAWVELSVSQVKEILSLNKKNIIVEIDTYTKQAKEIFASDNQLSDDSINRFDVSKDKKKKKKKKQKNKETEIETKQEVKISAENKENPSKINKKEEGNAKNSAENKENPSKTNKKEEGNTKISAENKENPPKINKKEEGNTKISVENKENPSKTNKKEEGNTKISVENKENPSKNNQQNQKKTSKNKNRPKNNQPNVAPNNVIPQKLQTENNINVEAKPKKNRKFFPQKRINKNKPKKDE